MGIVGMHKVLELERLTLEEGKFQTSLGYLESNCLKMKTKTNVFQNS